MKQSADTMTRLIQIHIYDSICSKYRLYWGEMVKARGEGNDEEEPWPIAAERPEPTVLFDMTDVTRAITTIGLEDGVIFIPSVCRESLLTVRAVLYRNCLHA